MAEDQDDSQKTEEPTQRRLEEAFKKGQIATSREVFNFMILSSLAITIFVFAPSIMERLVLLLRQFIESPHKYVLTPELTPKIFVELFKDLLAIIFVPYLIAIAAAFLAGLLQNPFHITFDPIQPDISKISIIKGFSRLFSLKSFAEFIKGILKIALTAAAAYIAVKPDFDYITKLNDSTIRTILMLIEDLIHRLFIAVLCVMAFVAILDYLYQKYEYIKGLRMSRSDIKDEFKQSEGNPEIKQKLRSIRQQRAKNRMMQNIPDSDVVITNPTHYAVVLKYDMETMVSPKIVAKGKDLIAQRIKEIAKEHDVMIVRNPPLARALFELDLDQYVPEEHYKAVAEIISYVFGLKNDAA